MLLYPISVLSGSVMLRRRGGLVLAGLATLFYAATLWAVRAGLVPAQGLADVPFLPAEGRPLLHLRHRRGLRHRRPHRLLPLGEPAPRGREAGGGGGAGGRPPRAERGDRQQHPERPPHHRRRRAHPLRQPLRGGDPGPAATARCAGATLRERASRRRCSSRPRSRRGPAASRWRASSSSTRGPAARALDLGRLGHAPRHRGPGGSGLPARLPGPDRHQAPGGGGAHQGEAGRGGGDGGPARPRDPQPPGLDQRLGPGAHGRSRRLRGAGAPPGHHHPGVASASRTP